MTLVEYVILFFLFFAGCFFITAFTGPERMLRSLAGAFPLGCSLWGAATFLTAALPLFPKDIYGFSLPSAMVLTGVTAVTGLFISVTRRNIVLRNIIAVLGGFAFLSFLYWLFIRLNISIVSGDSLSQIHPQVGMKAWADVRGFNQALAALAGFAGQDRYFFPYHSLFAISLLVLMGECIFHEVKSVTIGFGPALVASVVGPLLMASCHMTAINAFYVNNHMLVAVLIVFSLSILTGRHSCKSDPSEMSLPIASLGAIAVSFLCLLRLEGQLVALLLLVIMLSPPDVRSVFRVRAFLILALLTAPFQLFLIYFTEGKVNTESFVVILLATLLLPIFFSLRKTGLMLHLQQHSHKYVLLAMGIGIGFFFLINSQKMIRRLGWVLHNMLDESYWGFVHQTLLFAGFVLLGLRFFFHDPQLTSTHRRTDLMLFFYIASMLLIVFMVNFHGARLGWSDSQNRMLFHFLPAGILWVSIQAGLGLGRNSQHDSKQMAGYE